MSGESGRRLYLAAGSVLATQAAVGAASLATTPFIIHYEGVERFGLFSLVVSAQVVVALSDLGVANTVLTGYPKAAAAGDRLTAQQLVQQALARCIRIAAAIAAFAAAVAIAPLPWKALLHTASVPASDVRSSVAVLLGCTALNVVGLVAFKLRQAQGHSGSAAAVVGVASLVGIGTTVVAAWLHAPVELLVATTLLPIALSRLWLIVPSRLAMRSLAQRQASGAIDVEGRGHAAFFAFVQLVAVFAYEIDQVIVATVSGVRQVAMYAVVAKVASVALLVMGAVATPLWPYLSAAIARRDAIAATRAVVQSVAGLGVVAATLVASWSLWGDTIWRFVGNGRLHPSRFLVAGFSILLLLRAVDTVSSTYLNAVPVVRFQVICATAVLVTNVPTSILLVQRYGAAGAVWGSVATQLPCVSVPYLVRLRQHLRMLQTSSTPLPVATKET